MSCSRCDHSQALREALGGAPSARVVDAGRGRTAEGRRCILSEHAAASAHPAPSERRLRVFAYDPCLSRSATIGVNEGPSPFHGRKISSRDRSANMSR